MIPKIRMLFESYEDGYNMYNAYASVAVFGIQKGQKSGNSRYIYCSFQGSHKYEKNESERQRNKTTKRKGCPAKMRIKEKMDGTWIIADIVLGHNHPLAPPGSMKKHFHCHKTFDEVEMNFVKCMQRNKVAHAPLMNVLAELHGGPEFLPYNSKDIRNR
jgi:hypothetical protein